MRIARIAELNKEFLVIFEDGSELRLSEEIYFTCSIYEKEEMSPTEIEEYLFKNQVAQGLILCKKYLAGGLKPKRRLFAYMESRGVQKAVAEQVIIKLDKDNYLDDFKYALKRIKRKMSASPVSSLQMVEYLEREGVERKTAEKAVKKSNIDDKKIAMMLCTKKLKSVKGNKKKTIAYLVSKGFDEDIVSEVLGLENIWNM